MEVIVDRLLKGDVAEYRTHCLLGRDEKEGDERTQVLFALLYYWQYLKKRAIKKDKGEQEEKTRVDTTHNVSTLDLKESASPQIHYTMNLWRDRVKTYA